MRLGAYKTISPFIENTALGVINSRSSINGQELGTILTSLQCAEITFSNPSYNHKIWRSGTQYTGTISAPIGYTVAWTIVNHETRSVIASGSTTSVTHTFTFASVAVCNTYDLIVVATYGAKTFTRVFPGEFTCLPPVPVTYDVTYNTAGDKNGGWTNRAGQKILITGSISRINLYWFKSDDPTNPLHIVNKNLTITTTTNIISYGMTAFQNVIVEGCTEENVQYGAYIVKNTGSASQMVQLLGAEPNDNTKLSSNVILCGFQCNGNNITGAGITAFRILNNRDSSNHAGTFTFNRFTMFNCYGYDTYEETFYFGQSNDAPSGGLYYPYYTNTLYYRLRGANSGNEVMQSGLQHVSEMFCCDFRYGGLRNQNLHENLVQWSNGNQDTYFYMNYLEQGTHNLIAFFPGQTGGDCEFFSNVMYTAGKDGDGGGNIWGRSDVNDVLPGIQYQFYRNTIIWTAGASAFTLYENATPWDLFISRGNICVGATTTEWENANGVNAAHVSFDNLEYLTANIASVGFVDQANKDYNIASMSSPVFASYTAITSAHPYADYDYEGVEYPQSTYGAYSGYYLQTLEII